MCSVCRVNNSLLSAEYFFNSTIVMVMDVQFNQTTFDDSHCLVSYSSFKLKKKKCNTFNGVKCNSNDVSNVQCTLWTIYSIELLLLCLFAQIFTYKPDDFILWLCLFYHFRDICHLVWSVICLVEHYALIGLIFESFLCQCTVVCKL